MRAAHNSPAPLSGPPHPASSAPPEPEPSRHHQNPAMPDGHGTSGTGSQRDNPNVPGRGTERLGSPDENEQADEPTHAAPEVAPGDAGDWQDTEILKVLMGADVELDRDGEDPEPP